MGSGTSLIILVFALFIVVRTLGAVATALAEAIAALVKAVLTLLLVAGILLVLIAAQIGGCAGGDPGDEVRVLLPDPIEHARTRSVRVAPRYRGISATAWSMLGSRFRQLTWTRRPLPRRHPMAPAWSATWSPGAPS